MTNNMDKIILLIGIYWAVSLVCMAIIGLIMDATNKTDKLKELNIFRFLFLSPVLLPVMIAFVIAVLIIVPVRLLIVIISDSFKKGGK